VEINETESKIERELIKVYEPLLKQFIEEIKDVKMENLPVPFLPVCGKNYENAPFKIAFIGWETRDNSKLEEFFEKTKENPAVALKWFYDAIDEEEDFPLSGYGNNFGTGFWDLIMRFLAAFYNIDDWKKIKNLEQPDILKSFVWGNIDSIEKFNATAKNMGCSFKDWLMVKNASLVFDNANYLLNVFKPNIAIILTWRDSNWLPKDIIDVSKTEIIIENYLEYYYVPNTETHVYWTHHPGSRLLQKFGYDNLIFRIFQDINNRKVFEDFPGKKLLELHNKQTNLFEKLKVQLKNSATLLNVESLDADWGNGEESYFYFYLPNSKFKTSICFGFDKYYNDFSVGVDIDKKEDNYANLKREISLALSPIIGTDVNWVNWAYLHYFKDDLQNWRTNEKIWDGIINGQTCMHLMNIINNIIVELRKIQL